MDIKLDGLSIAPEAAGTAWGDRPLIHFCDTPEASVAVRPEGGPLVDLLLNTPDANRKAVAKPPHEVAQVRSGRAPAGFGLGGSQLGPRPSGTSW